MSDLTSLTLKAALDGLAAKSFSSVEITQAHVEAVEAARALNAYVPGDAGKGAGDGQASDARRAPGPSGPLEGAPLGIKDLSAPKASARPPARRSSATSSRPTRAPSPRTCGATARDAGQAQHG
jgi:Asp-tRNA(Asn)/Glu-tRNA(Gln) amidotransferase A subunit family amidase